jgi:hypothetical protein
VIIALQDCKKFLEILDWRGAMPNFLKGILSNNKFQTLFFQAMRSFPIGCRYKITNYSADALPKNTEKALNNCLESNENAVKLCKEMKAEYEVALARHKKYIKSR